MKKTILIAAVMFLAFSVAAFAQATFQVASTPVTQVASCGTTELTGDIAFTQVSGSLPITNGTITINYGVAITTIGQASFTLFDTNGTVIAGPTAVTAAMVSGSSLTLAVAPPGAGVAPYTIRLTGIRVNVAGNPGLTNLDANVSSTGNLFVGGQTSVRVISTIGSAIASVSAGTPSTALTLNAVAPAAGNFNVVVTEGFVNAWVANSMISITFSAIPTGLSITAPANITTTPGTVFQRAAADGTVANTTLALPAAGGVLTVYYKVTTVGATAPTTVETATFTPFAVATTAAFVPPLPQTTIQVTIVDMAPRTATPPVYTTFPQYSGTTCQRGPVTVVTIATANTTLLIPFATTVLDYDTAIAIANTTKDTVSGTNAAVAQSGTLTFMFFPQTGNPFQFTPPGASGTAGTPGSGLIAGGVLESGRTYIVLTSELLTAANVSGDFQGYIIAVCNFTNAHGEYFVSDFASFTHGALMLVLNNTTAARTTTPEGLNN